MEPIRPEEDELRAEGPSGGATTKDRAGQGPDDGASKPPKASARKSGSGGGQGGGSRLLWVLVVLVAGVGGAGLYWQNERINALEGQLEEADYWARQSKLALARFEGELSETGESLQERGETLNEKIAANGERLDTADEEIRKLWGVADDRNRKRLDSHKASLDEHGQRLDGMDDELAAADKAVTDLETTLAQARSSLSDDLAQLRQRLDDGLASLEQADNEAVARIGQLEQQMAEVDQTIENRLRRFEREQRLTMDGVESRLSALENKVGNAAAAGELSALKRQVAAMEETVESIDASRSQVTSRLIRLSEELDQLRAQ
ncbi:coiled-coil domain-containing protein [Marinobacter oulmenensis]|uniref:Chromosome segregation ATPase n=1 Tax=Marinobacter oulmenensis TaxID=643747 RepID=A0A840UAQ6_9GAMM|nr:hypothetical protein [Marinobacter oulmenensis]MBB5321293.1 chromosome segregation ATPase [Marinobacter oulmenensis]